MLNAEASAAGPDARGRKPVILTIDDDPGEWLQDHGIDGG